MTIEDSSLLSTATRFFVSRLKRLEKKESQGFAGWDSMYSFELEAIIKDRAKRKLTRKNLIDIANYCNFLWFRRKRGLR